MTGLIYEVVTVEDRRYIGQTTNPLRPERSRRKHGGVAVHLLEEDLAGDLLAEAENYWMARRLVEGFELLNKALAFPYSPERNAKCGRPGHKRHTPESRAKMSAARKGVPKSPEHRAKLSAARRKRTMGPLTPEHKAKLSAATKGRPKTAEHRANIAAGQTGLKRGPLSLEHRKAIGDAQRGKSWSASRRAAHPKQYVTTQREP